jgi:hypothetical protein
MVIARFIGPIPVIIGSVLFAIGGIIMIGFGAAASPVNVGLIVGGVLFIVGAALLILDAVYEIQAARRRSATT